MDFRAFAKVTFCNIGANFICPLRSGRRALVERGAQGSDEPTAPCPWRWCLRVVAIRRISFGWELHATLSLERLWRDQGKMQQTREPLAPIYGWFTEGF
jgi:hypothetical protein